ncbi:hypothetical protein BH23BAC4_BH23BAC4_07970 [soil metagenome]
MYAQGHLAILKGNLSPGGSVAKITDPARVFESEEPCMEAILAQKIKSGDIVVIRYEGAKGGPGMREMLLPTSTLVGAGLGDSVGLITDGRFSGGTWQSMVKCGGSIYNLAPAAPPALLASESPDGDVLVSVSTLASPPPDLAGYRVTRSADATCDASDVEVGIALDTGSANALLEDNATLFGTDVWYCATAIDVHGNESAYVGAVSANPAVLAALKVVLQGAYQSGLPGGALMRTDIEDTLPLIQPYAVAPWSYSGGEAIDPTDTAPANGRPDVLDNNAVVDWVLVEIRSSPSATDGKRAAALLLADGVFRRVTPGKTDLCRADRARRSCRCEEPSRACERRRRGNRRMAQRFSGPLTLALSGRAWDPRSLIGYIRAARLSPRPLMPCGPTSRTFVLSLDVQKLFGSRRAAAGDADRLRSRARG